MITYRKATINDIDDLVRTRIEFIKEVQNLETDFDLSSLKESLCNYFTNTIGENAFIAWLALDNNRIVATSGLCFYTLPPSYKNLSGKVAYIMNMYTVREYRNQGIAAHLFQRVIEEARGLGYKKISLHATESGKPLYTRFGFKEKDDEMVLNL